MENAQAAREHRPSGTAVAARSVPPRALSVRLKARIMGRIAGAAAERARQRRGRWRRRLRGGHPTIRYFHQPDDPHSHLAVQTLDRLAAAYAVDLHPHPVPAPGAGFLGDEARQPRWALADARDIAPFHGLEPPPTGDPDREGIAAIAGRLASSEVGEFATIALELGRAYFSGEEVSASASVRESGNRALEAGARLRRRLGHHGGAMFEYDGDWYWGVDRLPLLEDRLRAEGLLREAGLPRVAPTPGLPSLAGRDASTLTLEVFPSLRSPYTAVSFPDVLELIERTGIEARMQPVMPMMMRGVPAPRSKQLWILRDAARAGRRRGVSIERPVDPFGEPVRRALSLWAPLREAGHGTAFLDAYLHAAWIEGLDVTRDAGLLEVVRRAGADPRQLDPLLGGDASTAVLQDNLDAMLEADLWGVPAFRVSGGGHPPLAFWGQDRLWRVEAEIARRAPIDPSSTEPGEHS
jgi:2-hydroxychromene-2-carboxylate isomerase